jgi:hypothetical protein
MNTLTKALIIFISLYIEVKSSPVCKHLFNEDYLAFLYKEPSEVVSVGKESFILLDGSKVNGQINFSICGETPIPEICNTPGSARLILVADDKCPVIIKDQLSWEFTLGNYSDKSQMIKMDGITKEKMDYSVNYKFICQPNENSSRYSVHYDSDAGSFEIGIFDKQSCGYSLSFLKVLSEYPMVTASIFMTIGLVLCFFGLKFYKDLILFFIPTMIAILCFYLYLNVVEKSIEQNNKLFSVFLMVFLLTVLISLVVLFTNAIYFIIG